MLILIGHLLMESDGSFTRKLRSSWICCRFIQKVCFL